VFKHYIAYRDICYYCALLIFLLTYLLACILYKNKLAGGFSQQLTLHTCEQFAQSHYRS